MAGDYLDMLQRDQQVFSDPTQHPIAIGFAVLVIEGKPYATAGRTVFEAQNQASVSGSCANNQQHQLADFTKIASGGSFHSRVLPTGFSICTEGPYIESWGDYTREEDGIRKYKTNIMDICHATLLPGVVSFFHDLDKIRSWALDTLLEDQSRLGTHQIIHPYQPHLKASVPRDFVTTGRTRDLKGIYTSIHYHHHQKITIKNSLSPPQTSFCTLLNCWRFAGWMQGIE